MPSIQLTTSKTRRGASGSDSTPVCRSIAVARWLESVGHPAVRAINVDQPVLSTTTWLPCGSQASDDGDQFASTPEIADVITRPHRLTAPETLHLPRLDPFANTIQRLDANTWLTKEDSAFLTRDACKAARRLRDLEFVLPEGVIHGDASVGNVMRDRQGTPVLIDLDGFAIGLASGTWS